MLERKFPLPVKCICGIIYASEDIYSQAKIMLRRKFGEIDFESGPINFNFTDYYCSEMGKPLYRRIIAFKRLRDPAEFVKIKLWCMKVEKFFSHNKGKRQINLDPGYVDNAKLVLTTTKDFYHRIYLGRGIYAEVTLFYQDCDFQEFPTTYPDYRDRQHKDIFINIRKTYQTQIKNDS